MPFPPTSGSYPVYSVKVNGFIGVPQILALSTPILLEAASNGIAVTPVHPSKEVIKKLEAAGLPLQDIKFLNELNELISLIAGTAAPVKSSKRRSFSDSEKSKILEQWTKVESTGMKTKAAFSREVGVGYQTFINWLRE